MYNSVILLTRRSTRKVRITVVAADGLTDELQRVAADQPHRACALEHIALLAPHLQRHFRRAHVVQGEAGIEQTDERAVHARNG